ncbi:solute carrier family 49 member 4 homolog [Tubulanus polymorphus]|uniref:solute carrier family 49 member 4 homolog n=1 Tax=Tubulanus polymorphus TaxID=672921 RepID=UPI003DA5797D
MPAINHMRLTRTMSLREQPVVRTSSMSAIDKKVNDRTRRLQRYYSEGGSVMDVREAFYRTPPATPPYTTIAEEETSPFIWGELATDVYPVRWYILFLFSSLALTQSAVWNTWGPIAESAEIVFGIQKKEIALLSNWTCITIVLSMVFFLWLMEQKGLRWSVVVTAGLLTLGTGIRCITPKPPLVSWLMHIGAILNGLAGPVSMAAPPVISSTWFPATERTTATAIGSIFIYIGIAIPFIIGPIMVSSPPLNSKLVNFTAINSSLQHHPSQLKELIKSLKMQDENYVQNQEDGIMKLMYIEFGWTTLLFIVICIYFPEHPPKPPSLTASTDRVDFKRGIIEIFSNTGFWLAATPYALSGGFYIGWSGVLEVILSPLHVSQDVAGWLGFYSTIGGCIAGLLVGRLADLFAGRMKEFIIALFTGSAIMMAWFTCICMGWTKLTIPTLYISCILGISFLNGTIPLFFEMTCETCYPIAEFVTCGCLTMSVSLMASILLFLFWIPGIGTAWVNWCLLCSIILCIPLLMLFKAHYKRLVIDQIGDERRDSIKSMMTES